MITICVYLPVGSLRAVTEAMFNAGAGQVGDYDQCCYFSKGTGQFRPLVQSNPSVGKKLQINQVEELRLEMVTTEEHYANVISAMKQTHPYEEPAWHAFRSLGETL
jgi:hypothetical protein